MNVKLTIKVWVCILLTGYRPVDKIPYTLKLQNKPFKSIQFMKEMKFWYSFSSPPFQPTSAVLGERDQEPSVCLWHTQEQHNGCMSLCGGSDLHGLLLYLRAPPWERLALQQAALCQGHPQLQELGGKVSCRWYADQTLNRRLSKRVWNESCLQVNTQNRRLSFWKTHVAEIWKIFHSSKLFGFHLAVM